MVYTVQVESRAATKANVERWQMIGPKGRGSATAPDVVIAAVAAAAVLALGLAGAARSRSLTLEHRAMQDEAVLGEVSAGVAIDIERALVAVADDARNATAPGAAPPPGFVPASASTPPSASPALSPTDRSNRDVAAVLDRARDSGEALMGPSADLGDGPRTLLVAAAYFRDPVAGRPQTTVLRRARIAGWAVVPVDLAALLRANVPTGSVATISDGPINASSTGAAAPARLPERTIDTHGHQLMIRAGNPSAVALGAPTIALALAAVLLAAAAATGVLAALRHLRLQQEDAANRMAQIQLIGDVGPLVQQSLELADVLPSVAVQLSDHFGLAGVSLSTLTNSAGPVELFGYGEAPRAGAKAVLRPPAHLAAGDTLALALERGGRSVAQLQLVAGRDLDESELQSLRAITELVTAAIVNATLYSSQQVALTRLRDLDALKTVFLGTASHELRTPVTAISGFASLLVENWDRFEDGQRRDFVERISANARSLGGVVQDLLDFSLLDRGTLVVTIEEIDLAPLVGSVVDRLSPTLGDHQIEFAASPTPPIEGDVNGLERIVTNLLSNAVKFSPTGTRITVTVGPGSKEGYDAEMVVSDEGPGIPAEERQRVFTRFFRGSGDAVVQTRGVGIGLSVVAEFVARLHGEVDIDDAPGGGARFTVRFPASSASLLVKEAAHAPTS